MTREQALREFAADIDRSNTCPEPPPHFYGQQEGCVNAVCAGARVKDEKAGARMGAAGWARERLEKVTVQEQKGDKTMKKAHKVTEREVETLVYRRRITRQLFKHTSMFPPGSASIYFFLTQNEAIKDAGSQAEAHKVFAEFAQGEMTKQGGNVTKTVESVEAA